MKTIMKTHAVCLNEMSPFDAGKKLDRLGETLAAEHPELDMTWKDEVVQEAYLGRSFFKRTWRLYPHGTEFKVAAPAERR
jgi:hypothetical protein